METAEIWKPVVGYEGFYEVSNLGRVRSLTRVHHVIQSKGEWDQHVYGRILKPSVQQHGNLRYHTVALCVNSKPRSFLVHRLVASAFIPNPYNYPIINHIDCNGENNRVDNLEWCTSSWNNQWTVLCGHKLYPSDAMFEAIRVKVHCPELNQDFNSITEAKAVLGLNSDYATACVKNKGKKSKKYYSVQNKYTLIALSDKDEYYEYINQENLRSRELFTYGRHAVELRSGHVFFNFHEFINKYNISSGTASTTFYKQFGGYIPKYDCYLVDIGYRCENPFNNDEIERRIISMKCEFVRKYAKNVIRCDTTGIIYHSAQEAERQLNLPSACINERLKLYDGYYPKKGLHFSKVCAADLTDTECLSIADALAATFLTKSGGRHTV